MDIHPVHDSPDALNAFLEWFKSQPGAFFSPDIRIADLAAYGRGRGILATSDIPAHTRLFVVPRRRVLSVETSDVVRKIPHVFHGGKAESTASSTDDEAEFDELANPGLELILILIYEYLHHATSPWRPYLDALPDEFDALMYWDALELRELQASAVIEKIGRDDAEQMFHEKLLPLINDHADIFYPVGTPAWSDEDLVKLAHRMGSIVTAYAFDLEREDEDDAEFEDGWIPDLDGLMSLGLVPMADMLNADGEFNAHLNHEPNSLTMTTLRPIRAGDEVLNYYGPLPNSELLLRYGYTSLKHALYDAVEIPWGLIRQAILEELGDRVVLPPDGEMDESYVLERESGGPDETGVINASSTFTEFPEELEDQVAPILAPALGIDIHNRQLDLPEQSQLGRTFIEVMSNAIQARLKQYGTTIAADEELLRTAKPGTRYAKALAVRLGEKCLLQEALDFAAHALDGMEHEGGEEPDTRATKKQQTIE